MTATYPAASATTALAEGFAQLLAAANLGLSWGLDAAYDPTQVGIFIGRLPDDKPNQAVAITPYTLSRHTTFTSDTEGLNFRYRAGSRLSTIWDVRDAVNDHLRGRFPLRLPTGVHVSSIVFGSGSSLGRDDDQRSLWSDNWTVRTGAYRPT